MSGYQRLVSFQEGLNKRYRRLPLAVKLALAAYAVVNCVIIAGIVYIGPHAAFETLTNVAEDLSESPFGWAILIGLLVVSSIPPLYGYSTCVTLCGFIFWNNLLAGWLTAATGCLAGSLIAFVFCRRFIHRFASELLAAEPGFRALGGAIGAKGTKLVVLMRFCPFPFSLSNAFFAAIDEVSLQQFMVATAAITPKLLLHVWIGQRLFLFADPDSRGRMDGTTKLVNTAYIVVGALVGLGTGIYVYRLARQYAGEHALTLEDEVLHETILHRDSTSDVDDIERQLVAEGHLDEALPKANGDAPRPSTDAWGRMSDFGEEERDAWGIDGDADADRTLTTTDDAANRRQAP